MASGLRLHPDLINKVDGEEPEAEVEPANGHWKENWELKALININGHFEESNKNVWGVHNEHDGTTNRNHVCNVSVAYHNDSNYVMKKEFRKVSSVPMKQPRVQTLINVIREFNEMKVVHVFG